MIEFHFSKIGWIQEIKPFQIVFIPNSQLECLKILSRENNDLECFIDDNMEKSSNSNNEGIIGTTGIAKPIKSVLFKSKAPSKKIYYRICTTINFWSQFVENKWIGVLEKEEVINGFQFFILNDGESLKEMIKKANDMLIAHFTPKPQIVYKQVFNEAKKDNFIHFDIEKIKKCISNPKIVYISFDIFDTLLERPVIHPTDVFYLIEKHLSDKSIPFVKIRNIESACRREIGRQPSLDDIYQYIKKKNNYDDNLIDIIKKCELECEYKLLKKRNKIFELYLYAKSLRKRVICISDMYLSSHFLNSILVKEGYCEIEKVFVSNEYNSTKHSGELFKQVLNELNVRTDAVLHIGDNYTSDYFMPTQIGITSFHIPSSVDIFKTKYKDIFLNNPIHFSDDPIARIVLGFFINNYSLINSNSKVENNLYNNLHGFISLCLAMPIIFLTLHMINDKNIQNKSLYKKILFASRDGYLVKIIYDEFKILFPHILESVYMYTGRKSYFSAQFEKFSDFIENINSTFIKFSVKTEITPSLFIKRYIYDKNIQKDLDINNINMGSKDDFELFIKNNFKILESYYDSHRKEASSYYKSLVNNDMRMLVFDIGYSGSISILQNFFEKPVDKIYFRQTAQNVNIDKELKTNTFILMKTRYTHSLVPFEEFLSPLNGGTVGYSGNVPILEEETYSDTMVSVYKALKNDIKNITKDVISFFGEYCRYLNVSDTRSLFEFYDYSILKNENNPNVLKGITFKDTFGSLFDRSLLWKMISGRNRITCFDSILSSNLYYHNKQVSLSYVNTILTKYKCAVYIDILDIKKLSYLFNHLPYNCDLYLAIDLKYKDIVSNMFFGMQNVVILPKANYQSLYTWVSNYKSLENYDLVLMISTDTDHDYYPLSEFESNINFVFSPTCLSQVEAMINDSDLSMLSLAFSKEFEEIFNSKYVLCGDKVSLELIHNYFMQVKNIFGKYTLVDDYPIEYTEYTKLFNESFWYCPKKLPKELFFLNSLTNNDLKTNQRMSILIPTLLNRINDDSFKYFSRDV